jgi:hypothetical protein
MTSQKDASSSSVADDEPGDRLPFGSSQSRQTSLRTTQSASATSSASPLSEASAIPGSISTKRVPGWSSSKSEYSHASL